MNNLLMCWTSRRRRAYQVFALTLLVVATSCVGGGDQRIVAFGDVHGDLEAARGALRLAGAIDDQDRWIGGDLIVVQTGDQLDRGDQEQAILDLFERLRIESEAAGGAFHALLGNHELLNARLDFRYVTDGGYADFMDVVEYDPSDSIQVWDGSSASFRSSTMAEFEPHQRPRVAAFMPGGPYANLLAKRQVIARVGDNIFVHGGVLPEHVAYGIDAINSSAQAWLRGDADLPSVLSGSFSPQWTRLYSDDPDSSACSVLEKALNALEAKRIVMGHTIQQSGITSACGARAWRIDVAMAAYYAARNDYGGSVEVLEIVGDSVRVLKEGG
ncbi:MAG: calcineurin [Gemmatimonadales bacterium]|nr:calcineurin [Gemmatimonadales bacterium]MBT4913171.1 calcineurin [Gemmatimonadales bacterium]